MRYGRTNRIIFPSLLFRQSLPCPANNAIFRQADFASQGRYHAGGTAPPWPATSFPRYGTPPLIETRRPRCPPYVAVSNVDQRMPYLEVFARRAL
jgi:hypothetical protein